MKKILSLFRIRKDERWLALVSALVFLALNAMVVCKYFDVFSRFHRFYWPVFIRRFHVSGFDPITYYVVTEWHASYNVYRHPLLAFFMYPLYLLNQGLMWLTGMNCVQLIVAVLLTVAAMYAAVYMRRIFREIVGLRNLEAYIMTAFTFSFAYVMVPYTVPDHFALSMTMLLVVLYVTGIRMKQGKPLTIVQTVVMFVFTAGISLNNGIKVFLANFFSRGKRFFRPANLVFAILLPAGLMWYGARVEYAKMVYPEWHAKRVANARKDSIAHAHGIKETKGEKAQKARIKVSKAHSGKPIKQGEFWSWTDITTPRIPVAVENLFGESILLHKDHLLEDTLVKRPVIVPYRNWGNYIAEGIIVALFLTGLWLGRRSRFLWTAMSFFLFDMAIHMGIGFGINEVYIMGAHWLYVIPIATAYVLAGLPRRWSVYATCVVALLTGYLWVWNTVLYASYLL